MDNKAKNKYNQIFDNIRSMDPGKRIAGEDRHKYNITHLKKGSGFEYKGDFYLVQEVFWYNETDDNYKKIKKYKFPEFKIVKLATNESFFLDWEQDDEIKASLTTEEVKLSHLKYDDGKTIAKDSDDYDEIAQKEWEVVYKGITYDYEDDYPALYAKADTPEIFTKDWQNETEKAYFYEFEADNGDCLTIEIWIDEDDKEDFKAYTSKSVNPDDFVIHSI